MKFKTRQPRESADSLVVDKGNKAASNPDRMRQHDARAEQRGDRSVAHGTIPFKYEPANDVIRDDFSYGQFLKDPLSEVNKSTALAYLVTGAH